MVVRPATPDDAEAIERIRVRGWQVGYRHLYPPEELDALELDWTRWARRIERPPSGWATFVAEAHGRTSASPRSARAATSTGSASCTRSTSTPTSGRAAPGARSSRGRSRGSPSSTRRRRSGCWRTTRVRAASTRRPGWRADGARQRIERLGVSPPEVRYRKRLAVSRLSFMSFSGRRLLFGHVYFACPFRTGVENLSHFCHTLSVAPCKSLTVLSKRDRNRHVLRGRSRVVRVQKTERGLHVKDHSLSPVVALLATAALVDDGCERSGRP